MKNLNDDWRLMNQESYLKQERLKHTRWFSDNEEWDHDHCAFCSEKIDTSTAGQVYCTTDYYHWICEGCYADFKDAFEWELEPGDSG